VQDVGDMIRLVGAENVVLTSDTGQLSTAMPIEAIRLWISHMRTQGFNQDEIDKMTKTTPARLLGLD
jgi:predicted metal-dependent phosphotriesterase family hydrolase